MIWPQFTPLIHPTIIPADVHPCIPKFPHLSGYETLSNPFRCTVCILAHHSIIPFFTSHLRGSIKWQLSEQYLCLNPGLYIGWRVILGELNFANTAEERLKGVWPHHSSLTLFSKPFCSYALMGKSGILYKIQTKSQY